MCAHPRLRGGGAARSYRGRRDRREPAPLARAGGRRGRRLRRAARRRPHHHDAPRPRPLPRQGRRPRADVRRALRARGRLLPGAAAARCTSPTRAAGSSAPTAIVGGSFAARRRRGVLGAGCSAQDRVAVAFFGEGAVNRGRVPRGPQPRRALAAAGDLLSARTTSYAELTDSAHAPQRRRRRPTRAAPTGSRPRASTATTSRPCTPRRAAAAQARAGGGPALLEARPTAGSGHYEGDPEPLPPEDEVAGLARRATRSCACARRSLERGAAERRASSPRSHSEARARIDDAASAPRAARARRPRTASCTTSTPRLTRRSPQVKLLEGHQRRAGRGDAARRRASS